ncbi:MAG: hypothetical protein KM310_06890 [Clostridiales bacterium]|nr:hypothetical protein [Clostridiales bacterium]
MRTVVGRRLKGSHRGSFTVARKGTVRENQFSVWARALFLSEGPKALYARGPWRAREFVGMLVDLLAGGAGSGLLVRRSVPQLLAGIRLRKEVSVDLLMGSVRRSVRRGMDPVVAAVYWRVDPALVRLVADVRVERRVLPVPEEGQLSLFGEREEIEARLRRYCRR